MLPHVFEKTSHSWILALLTVMLVNTSLLWWFHDRTWWPPDDGQLAHVAERLLHGEVLHRDIQDVRPGYVNFINAAALAIFGPSLLSLRYPLVLIALLQSLLLFWLFKSHGAVLAGALAVSSVTLGVLHYINPNHHWYALFCTIALICHLTWTPRTSRWYLPLAGLFIITIGCFRQLTGAFVGMGTLSYLLFEESQDHTIRLPWHQQWMGRLICFSMLAFLTWYFLRTIDFVTFTMFGLWPSAFLVWQLTAGMTSNKRTLDICGGLSAGIMLGAVPLLTYHGLHGSLVAMIDDNFFRALHVLQWDYTTSTYWGFLKSGLIELYDNPGWISLLNGIYFVVLPLVASFNGILLIRAISHRKLTESLALPVLATFYGLVSILTQVPVYLYFTCTLSIAGFLWTFLEMQSQYRRPMVAILLLLSSISLTFHAGEEAFIRNYIDYIRPSKTALFSSHGQLPQVDLRIDKYSLETYRKVVQIINDETNQGDYIFTIPNNAELYFMTGRRNPFRFFSTDHGVTSQLEAQSTIQQLKKLRPRIIIFSPDDTRNSPYSETIMKHVRQASQLLSKDLFFEVYLYQGQPSKNWDLSGNAKNLNAVQQMKVRELPEAPTLTSLKSVRYY